MDRLVTRNSRVLVRADASRRIGTGHVMRCLALAQAARKKGATVTFLSADNVAALQKKLRKEGMGVARLVCRPGSPEDAEKTVQYARKMKAGLLVVDGYQFGADYQKTVRTAGLPFLCVDDHAHAAFYRADLVLNQNINAAEKLYKKRSRGTRLLLGPRYALLREEFLAQKSKDRKAAAPAKNILVTMGGSDPDNVTLKVVRALESLEAGRRQVIVVLGPGNAHAQSLKKFCKRSKLPVKIEANPRNMAVLMAWADVAVSGAGSTFTELAYMGVPSILLVLAENQKNISRALARLGAAVDLGWHADVREDLLAKKLQELLRSSSARKQMSRIQRKLVDGLGARRILAEARL